MLHNIKKLHYKHYVNNKTCIIFASWIKKLLFL